MPDATRELWPAGGPGIWSSLCKAKFSLTFDLWKQTKGREKPILLLTPGAAGLCRRGCAGPHDLRQCIPSIPSQAQQGARADSHLQVSLGSCHPQPLSCGWPGRLHHHRYSNRWLQPTPALRRSLNTEQAFGSPLRSHRKLSQQVFSFLPLNWPYFTSTIADARAPAAPPAAQTPYLPTPQCFSVFLHILSK